MKTFLVFFVCAFALANASSSEENAEKYKEVSDLLKSKFNITILEDVMKLAEKVQAKCPDLEEKIESTAEEVGTCLEEIELGSETFCSLIRKNFLKCSKPARDLIVSCLPEESKDLPLMVEKILLAIVDQACNSTVEEILELFNPCVVEKDLDEFPQCKGIPEVFKSHKDQLPSKSLVCEMLPKLKGCAKAHQEASCKNPITNKAQIQFHEAIDDAIKDDCDELNKA